MPTLMLSKKEVRRLINIRDVIDVVEAAFKDYTEGKGEMPSKVRLTQFLVSVEAFYTAPLKS